MKSFIQHNYSADTNVLLDLKVMFAYDGAQNSQRVEGTTQRKLYTKVVDQVLISPSYTTRLLANGEPFEGKTMDITLDVVADTQGQWFTGLEQLNMSAVTTTVTTSYAHTAFTQPQVVIGLESFANVGSLGVINLDAFKYEKAAAQVMQSIGSAVYGTGSGNQMLGLEAQVDNGTNNGTIGGISRGTYPQLNGYVTAATGGSLSLPLMAQVHDNVRAAGMSSEKPNVAVTTKGIFTLYEQLLSPNVRASYDEVGYDKLSMKGKYAQRNTAQLRNSAGFDGLSYRTMHVIDDDFAVTSNIYFMNEDYANFYGRYEVPEEWRDSIEHVDFGTPQNYEGTGALVLEEMPSEYHGFFYQKPLVIPEQFGKAARFYVIGQYILDSFRRHGKATGVLHL